MCIEADEVLHENKAHSFIFFKAPIIYGKTHVPKMRLFMPLFGALLLDQGNVPNAA